MKTLFSIAPFVFAVLVSCGSTEPISGTLGDSGTGENQNPNITRGTASVSLVSKDQADTTTSTINYAFYTTAKLPFEDSVNLRIKKFISGNISMIGPDLDANAELTETILQNSLDGFAASYYEEMGMYDDDDFTGGVWSTDINAGIYEGKADHIEVSMNSWSYTGGAHGNSWSEETSFDKKTGRELKLADFITDIDELSKIAEVIFRADQEIEADTDLNDAGFWFEDGIFSLNENFVFNSGSLDFLYNQYEIAPYAAGVITISIPRDKIKHLLKRKVD